MPDTADDLESRIEKLEARIGAITVDDVATVAPSEYLKAEARIRELGDRLTAANIRSHEATRRAESAEFERDEARARVKELAVNRWEVPPLAVVLAALAGTGLSKPQQRDVLEALADEAIVLYRRGAA